MANQTIFKRYEYKYLLTADQKKDLQAYMETYMKPDTFGRNTICNLYFDTPDYLLIRRSIEGKVYKEKIRLRTYGRAQDDSEAFIELKKKLKDGTFTIDFCDDSLHTNGNLSICGGTYTLSTGDDGMHADGSGIWRRDYDQNMLRRNQRTEYGNLRWNHRYHSQR